MDQYVQSVWIPIRRESAVTGLRSVAGSSLDSTRQGAPNCGPDEIAEGINAVLQWH